jgi:hypothetical protein
MRPPGLGRALLVATSAAFLAGILVVAVALNVVASNVEEVRSLPKTYRWIIGSFALIWVLSAAVIALALRRGGVWEWLARGLLVLGVNVLVWDMFRTLWLDRLWQVIAVGAVELALLVISWRLLRRVPLPSLLTYAGVFAAAQIALATASHVRSVGPHPVVNALREARGGAGDASAPHPNPWRDAFQPGPEIPAAFDLGAAQAVAEGVELRREGGLKVSGPARPGAALVSIPLALSAPLDGLAVAELRMRVPQGSLGVGIRTPRSQQWFFRDDVPAGTDWQTVRVPIYRTAQREPLLLLAGGFETGRVDFELESLRLLRAAAPAAPAAAPPNVYQVLLDEAEMASFLELAPEYPQFRYPGFTFFDNFTTGSDRTKWSLPQIVSGTLYDPAQGVSAEQWSDRSFRVNVFRDLHEAGVGVWQYPSFRPHCQPGVEYCLSTQDFRAQFMARVSDTFVIDLAFLRVLPNSLRAVLIESVGRTRPPPQSWDYGFSLTAFLLGPPPASSEDEMLREYYQGLSLFTINHFQQMLVDETKRPDRGQFVFLHSLVPHAPYARDAECRFIPKSGRSDANVAERARAQSICSLKLVGWLEEQLRLLDRYDQSLVIIHSDHGAPRTPPSAQDFQRNDADSSEWPDWLVESISAGLLLVKWPGEQGFHTLSVPAQSYDLVPTVLQHFGVALPDRLVGTPLQRMGPDFDRIKVFHASNPPKAGTRLPYFSSYLKSNGQWRFEKNIPAQP